MNVVVIGGGPAGMMAAITAAKNKDKVTILEKTNSLGKKLLITGKGRCNITSSLDISEFINNIPGNGKFLYSAFQMFNNRDIIELMKKNNVKVKQERGNRIFPVSDNAKDVLDVFYKELKKLGVNILYNCSAKNIIVKESVAVGVWYEINGKEEKILADKIILATGGKSYPVTGSTGDGYKIASKLGHNITKIKASLIPIVANENNKVESIVNYNNSKNLCKAMQGLSLKNVEIKLCDISKNKIIYKDFGELLFTHFGISGPTVLSASAHLIRYKNIDELINDGKIVLKIDLKPALSEEKLDARILRDFSEEKNKEFKNSLNELLPKKMIDPVVILSQIDPLKKVNEISKKERENIVKIIKNFTVVIGGFRPVEEAIVTAGGISVKEINPKTMESKLIKNLYFAGEVIDVDAYTGGFNLQIAYSTGYVAGSNQG